MVCGNTANVGYLDPLGNTVGVQVESLNGEPCGRGGLRASCDATRAAEAAGSRPGNRSELLRHCFLMSVTLLCYVYIYMYINEYTYVYIYTHIHGYVYIYMYIHVYMCLPIDMYACACIYIYTYTQSVCVHIYIYMYVDTSYACH